MRARVALAVASIAGGWAAFANANGEQTSDPAVTECRQYVLAPTMPPACLLGRMVMSFKSAPGPVVASTPESAQEGKDEPIQWRAKLSTSAWSSNRRLDDAEGVGYAQALGHLSKKWSDGVAVVAAGYIDREEAPGSEADKGRARLREAYLRLRSDKVTFSLGPQIIAWGRADVINPTDNVSARDYTMLVGADADQKLGAMTANLSYRSGNLTLQGLAQGPFRRDQVPLPEVDGAQYINDEPDRSLASYGAKVDWSGDSVSWSLSVLSGAMKRPNLRLDPTRVSQGMLDLNYPDAVIYGSDVEWIAGQWVVRGEAAYSDVDDTGSNPLSSRESSFFGVLGVERDFGAFSGFVQAVHRRTYDYVDPFSEPDQTIRTLAVANAALNEETRRTVNGVAGGFSLVTSDLVWEASTDFLYIPATDELAIRPRLQYRWTDSTTVWLGGDYFKRSGPGIVGRLADNRSAFVGLSMSLLKP